MSGMSYVKCHSCHAAVAFQLHSVLLHRCDTHVFNSVCHCLCAFHWKTSSLLSHKKGVCVCVDIMNVNSIRLRFCVCLLECA